MTKTLMFALMLSGSCAVAAGFVACGSSSSGHGGGGDGGGDSTTDTGGGDSHGDVIPGDGSGEGAIGDGGLVPDVFNGDGGCFTLGNACGSNGECCSNDCSNGVCIYPPCTSDGLGCGGNGDCCSQSCDAGTCQALNPSCGTLGNACGAAPDGGSLPACCSSYCVSGRCQQPSYCGQVGEACSAANDCCSGVCTKTGSQLLGICGAAPTTGANCNLTDGMLCAGSTADGGIFLQDGGVPTCGGACCSRSCAPWGPTGVLVCQPASGCHLVGDTCTSDNDCCGSAAYPLADGGAQSTGGFATCSATGGGVGVCQNPTGCKPNGAVCKLKTMSCNASCDCCSGNCETDDTCKQDNLGVPRCTGAACVDAGSTCSSSADCCNGNPCVPDPNDAGAPLTCYPYQCVHSCGTCSNTADCCPGSDCLGGVCGPCGTGADGGAPGDGGGFPDASGLPPDGGAPPPPDGGCAAYGQLCATSSECCNGVPCTGGRCQFIAQ
ncbi:MAG: hypothetical protein ACRELB_27215 [Polyangiaceae bacterium]